jgi:molybdopterin molybdotransferase
MPAAADHPEVLGPLPPAAVKRDLSVAEARAAIAAALRPLSCSASGRVPLARADGRILAADLLSPIDVPAHDNLAMDGFAFDGALLEAGTPLALPVVASVHAGSPLAGAVPPAACVRTMTGAVMPSGADTVVRLELVQVGGGGGGAGSTVALQPGVNRRGENRRKRGEDLARGKPALTAGRVLRSADTGLVASLGLTEVEVMRPLKVALFSTGDEVAEPGTPLVPGAIYDSNRHSLASAQRVMQRARRHASSRCPATRWPRW